MPKALLTLACACCVLALAVTASAQPAHQLSGVVRDTTGGVLSGVSVSVAGATLGIPRSVATDMQGRYLIELPVGRYLITATLSGFEPRIAEVDMDAGPATLDLVLAVSPLSERVTVTATKTGAADIQTTPIAVTTLAASTLEQTGDPHRRGSRRRRAIGDDLAAQRGGPGDHPRHRHQQHRRRRRPQLHGSPRRRLPRTPRHGACPIF